MAKVPYRDIGVREPSLIEHVQNILQRYPEGGQILKELIQNADDAGATEIKFMVDPRHHGKDGLWLPGLENFQGPALLAWNNAEFSENDWESVFHIYKSLKKADPMKVGRFGLGFISVYHITDLPFILSNDTIAVFDPCRKNINVQDEKDGSLKTGHWQYLKEFRNFPGSVRCFEGLFGFSSQQDKYKGTIFRFPLRNHPSGISNNLFDCEIVIKKLYKSLVEEAPFILLFLKNITRIGLYCYNEQHRGCEQLLYEVVIDQASVHAVQRGRRMCRERAMKWATHSDIFCHLNSFSVSFKNNFMKTIDRKGIHHWLVMNCIAGKNCGSLGSFSKNLNVIPWAGVAAELPVHLQLGGDNAVSFGSGCVDIGNQSVAHMLQFLSNSSIQIPWLQKPPNLPGHAFCFLPLPSHIGLPVFVHGYFSVADNRRSIKWPSHDEQGEEAKFNEALVKDLITPTYAFLLACRSCLITYERIPSLYMNPDQMLDPYCIWPLLSQHGQAFSMWSTVVDPVIELLVNHDLPVAWTAAGGGRRTGLLSALYLPGTFTGAANNVSNVVIEVLTALDKSLVILPTVVAQVISRINNIKQKIWSREISPCVIRSILKENVSFDRLSSILTDKQRCSALLEYVLSDLSESNCSELEDLPLLPVDEAGELPKPFVKQGMDCFYILTDQQCSSFLPGVTKQLIWSRLPYNVLQQLKKIIGFNQYQLKIADAVTVCNELLPKSMSKWTNSNGKQVQWKPGAQRHPPLQWLKDVWGWLNKKSLNENTIDSLSIVPKECLDSASSIINLIPLSYSGGCFLISNAKSVPVFLPSFLESLGFKIVHETPLVFAQSWIKEKFNPISPDSIIKVLTNHVGVTSSIVKSVKARPHGDKVEFLRYIAQLTRNVLSKKEIEVVRQLPLFKPIGSDQFVSLNNQEWILLTNGVQLLPNLQYPQNIIGYTSPEECRLLKLLGCHQPTFSELCINHVIPFALSCVLNNANNTHNLMKWILHYQLDEPLRTHLMSCQFVPGGISGKLAKPCDLFDPKDPHLRSLFDQHEDCIPSNMYQDYLPVLRQLGLQTWDTVSHDETKFNQFLIDRAKSVSGLSGKSYVKAFDRSLMIVRLLNMSPNINIGELADVPFLFCQNQRPNDYPKQLKWHGEGIKTPFPPRNLYSSYHKLLIGSVGAVTDDRYGFECNVLSGILRTPYILDLFSQLTILSTTSKPSHSLSKIVYFIYQHFNESRELLVANRASLPPKWIWIEANCRFISADECAINSLDDLDLSPQYYSLSQIHQLKEFLGIFALLGVSENFRSSVIGEVLSKIKSSCLHYSLTQSQLKTVLQILQWIHNTGKQDIEILIPTENMQLLPPKDCTYNDLDWSDERRKQRRYTYVHQELPSKRAKYFQVIPLSHRIAPSKRIGLKYTKMGPHQPVTGRLREAIEEYGGDVDVFKELLQNADDARATQAKFIVDWRQHPCDTLLNPEMKHWQGPALLAYNNAVFTNNDFENICELAGGSKKSDPTKIGRFGIGFCSIYHLTDVPSFISSNCFIVFDPHTSYLGSRVSAGEPGMQINMKDVYSNFDVFKDQFAPYCGLLDFDIAKAQNGYNSTFFRFPFRNEHTARKSKISNTIYNRERVKQLCDTLMKSAPDLLVFLQNVKEISLYELDSTSNVKNLKCLLTVTKTLEAMHFGQTLIEQFRQGYDIETYQKKIFKIECHIGQAKQECHWMVTSCLGTGESKAISKSAAGKVDGLCPLGEIGVRLNKSSSFVYPLPADGKLFCFLPLPIPCKLKFYCSGYFEVSKDRRWLKKDASSGNLNRWNSAIISDALYQCFLQTLVNLTKTSNLSLASETEKANFLTAYYALWPTNTESFAGRLLFREIKRSVCSTSSCILWSDIDGGKWLSPKASSVYNHHDRIKPDIRKEIIQLLLQHRYPVIDIPYDIRSIMGGSIQVIHYKDFCTKVLIPNVATLPVQIRDNQILALLEYMNVAPDTQWAKTLLIDTRCIPARPNGRLRKPSDLVDPTSHLAKLYFDADECFPMEVYMKEDGVAAALTVLGMSSYELTSDKLTQRASSVMTIPVNEAIQRAKQILLYLSQPRSPFRFNFSTTTNVDALQNIPFIPVLKRLQGLSLPWCDTSAVFYPPKRVFSCKYRNLVFSQAPVVISFENNDQMLIGGLNSLGIEGKHPSVELVTAHLVCLVKYSQLKILNSSDCELLNECCPDIYRFLQNAVTAPIQNKYEQVSKLLRGLPFIWQGNHFLTVDQVKLDSDIADAFPYLCELSDENKKYKDLFIRLGVAVRMDPIRLLSILDSMCCDHKSNNLSDKYINFAITIAAKLGAHSFCSFGKVLYLPDENGIMRPSSNLAYKESVDLPDLQGSEILTRHFSEGTFWLHHKFTASLAKDLGIPSALNSILNEMSKNNFLKGTEYEQCEDLCDRLNSILRKYPHDESIFKEFIQNADDAGASEIVFVLDHRKFESEGGGFFSSDPEWRILRQYPSLLVYNNKSMSEEDIIGITKLGRGNKGFSPDLIGRFGIGFNVAYHVTDCAMFVSYGKGAVPENFCILDPGGLFAPGHRQSPSLRGKRFEMDSLNRQQFAKEFDPFYSDEVFLQMSKMCDGCFSDISTRFSNGCVLFRLPFTRDINHPCDTALKHGYKMNTGHMQKLFKALSRSAEDLVLFLNNIKSISAFEIRENGACLHHFTTSVSQSSRDVAVCTEHIKMFKSEVKSLRSKLDKIVIPRELQAPGRDLVSRDDASVGVECNSFPEVTWGYQLKVQTVTHKFDTVSRKLTLHKTDSVWFVSQQFGSKQIPTGMLKEALSDGLIPKGGVAVQVYSSEKRTTPFSLFCSLPLPIKSNMPVHINGNFWVDDSRKHLEFGATISTLTGWNCCLTETVIADAYINALVSCKQFLPDKSTEWYYSIFPENSNSDSDGSGSSKYPFGLYKIMYLKIVQRNLTILQQDNVSLTSTPTWLPVVGKGQGYFFHNDAEQILRKLLIEFGVKLTKAPVNIYYSIKMAASIIPLVAKAKYNALIDPVMYIQILKSLNLQQHKETIIKNIIILLKYCLSTEEACNAIRDAPLLLTYSGSLRQMSTAYGSKHARLLPHKSDDFIHPELEKHDFIHKLSRKLLYTPVPSVDYVSGNLQIQSCEAPIDVKKCPEIHLQIKELWSYLNDFFGTVRAKLFVGSLNRFINKPIIPASNKTLVPVCNGKMVLSPNGGGPVREIMKLFGYPVLDFSILCDSTFPTFAYALDKILTHYINGDDILQCIKLNNSSPVLNSSCNLVQYKEDLKMFLNLISTSLHLYTAQNYICKLPIFEAITGDMVAIKELKDTYVIPNDVPLTGLKEVMKKSPVVILKPSPFYVKVYKSLKLEQCDVDQFYLKAIVPFLQVMETKEIIKHISFVYRFAHYKVLEALKASKFIYVADRKKWCSVSEFYDPDVKLFQQPFSSYKFSFPPEEWYSIELHGILRFLGLQRDISWELLLNMVKDIEKLVKQNVENFDEIIHQETYCMSKELLGFIHDKLCAIQESQDKAMSIPDVGKRIYEQAVQFCKNISQIVFIPLYKDGSVELTEIITGDKRWSRFNNACFASHFNTTFLERDIITSSFSLDSAKHSKFIAALGIEDPPSCQTVIQNLLQLSGIAHSRIQSSKKQCAAIKNFLKKLFYCHYAYLEEHATPNQLCLLQGTECLFVENILAYSVVSGDCLVRSIPEPLFPYLCQIPQELTDHQKIIAALGICDEPTSCHYARILERIHREFSSTGKKLSENSKYLELASKACDCLVDVLHKEEGHQSVPESFNSMPLYLLDKKNELCKATELAYDDVPWYSKRLESVASYKYMKPVCQGRQDMVPLPQSLGVKSLSSLVVEELDKSVQLPDNHCSDERGALQRGQQHGCPFVLSLENLLLSSEFKLGVQRIIYHQKLGVELTEKEVTLTEKLHKLKFACYYKIVTVLKERNGQVIQGSSQKVYSVLCNCSNQNLLLCLAPHCDDKDGVVKELAQNINRYLSCIVKNESHLEAMIKCPSHVDIEGALDKCKVKSYTAADQSIQKLPSVGESMTPNITDLVIVLNYNKGESVKYWDRDGKLILAKVVAVRPKVLPDLSAKSLIICTSENSSGTKINTSPIFVSKYLQPSFLVNWLNSEKKMDCSGLLLYHFEDDCNPLVIQKAIITSFKYLSCHQIGIVFKRLFFHLHFYFVRCCRKPEGLKCYDFKHLSMRYFEEQVALFEASPATEMFNKWLENNSEQILSLQQSFVSDEESKLSELFEDMCIYVSDAEKDSDTRDEDMATKNPFENRDFMEQDSDVEESLDNLRYKRQKQNVHYRKVHLQKAANISGTTRSPHRHINTAPQPSAQPKSSPTFTNVFSQPVVHSSPTTGNLFRTSTGGYRSRAYRPKPTSVGVWNQSTNRALATSTSAPPKTNFRVAFMWLQQAVADFNAAKHYVKCTGIAAEQGSASKVTKNVDETESNDNPCQFPALICFLSHEVVEKSLKAVYLAKCGSTIGNEHDLNLVALYDQLSTAKCWPLLDVKDFVLQVSDHNMRCRYPDHHVPPEAPCVLYTGLDARHALAAAQEVFVKVCNIKCFKDKLPSQPTTLPLLPSTVHLDPNTLPEEWEHQDTDFELYLLDDNINEEEFTKIATLFFQSLPGLEIRTIERIQNRVLWKKYSTKSRNMHEDNIPCRERTLFHGAGQTNPKEIYKGDSSFDMRHSRDGLWGKGNYFAVNASLSNRYAYQAHGVKKLLLARVLTGFSYFSPPKKFLKPPLLQSADGSRGVQRRYNSVTGQLDGSTVYITYENDFAYPAYIITYT